MAYTRKLDYPQLMAKSGEQEYQKSVSLDSAPMPFNPNKQVRPQNIIKLPP